MVRTCYSVCLFCRQYVRVLSNANVIKLVSETSERELKKVFFASLDAARVCSRFWFSVTQAVSRE